TTLDQLALANTPITSMRSAQRTPDSLRLVIDLSKAVNPKSFVLAPNQEYGHRLVVDLFDKGVESVGSMRQPVAAPSPTPAAPLPPVSSAKPLPRPVQPSGNLGAQRDVVISSDAGHGGEVPGAIGPKGV